MNHTLKKLPADSEEFASELQEYRKTPEGAVAGCIAALNIMAENFEEGEKAFLALVPDTPSNSIRLAGRQLAESPWLIRSYFAGTSPENGYTVPEERVLNLSTNLYSGSPEQGSVKFFVDCSGAQSARPVTVERKGNGSWYPREWSSLVMGMVKPKNT